MKTIEELKIRRDRAGHDPRKLRELVELLLSYVRDIDLYQEQEEREKKVLEEKSMGKALDALVGWNSCNLSPECQEYWKIAIAKLNKEGLNSKNAHY